MDLGLSDKRAAIAGGSAGLGFSTAKALVEAGVRVAICGRDQDRLDHAVSALGTLAVGIRADVSTTSGATGFVESAVAELGGVDILVPNAGGPPPGTFASTPLDAYGPALELNLLSTVAMCQAAVPAMQERGWGRVVAITSASVRQPIATLILSNTARAGVTGFLKTLALEVAEDGVTVNSVQPGLHLTDRMRALGADPERAAADIPTGVIGDPDDFGAVCAFLCSQQAKFVTGSAIPVDGGTIKALQ
ncbi:MAG: SDR family oxidoreductase [Acidimicrobiales bacterium]